MRFKAHLFGMAFCFCVAAAVPALAGSSAVVRSEAQLNEVLSSGQASPLDALTPFGKRRFIAGLVWGQNGLGGFGFSSLVRELDAGQLGAILEFFDNGNYSSSLSKELLGPPLRLAAPSLDIEKRLQNLEAFAAQKRDDANASYTPLGGAAILRHYEEQFGNLRSALKTQAAQDLPLLFDAAALTAQENPGSAALADLLVIHREMVGRGLNTRRSFDGTVLSMLLAAREFESAREFAVSRPHLAGSVIPKVIDPLGPGFEGRTVFEYDAQSNTLTRRAAPYANGLELVMVVDGGCHFSSDALQALRSDRAFQERLRKANLTLVTPPRSPISTGFLASWNRQNPALPITVPYSAKEWQVIDVTGVPAFYLLKDGWVVGQQLSGWPQGGNAAALVKLLDTAEK